MKTYENILPTADQKRLESMRFEILDIDGSSILGAPVSADNAAFTGLVHLLQKTEDGKVRYEKFTDLGVGEGVNARFQMSQTVGVYRILRTQ